MKLQDEKSKFTTEEIVEATNKILEMMLEFDYKLDYKNTLFRPNDIRYRIRSW